MIFISKNEKGESAWKLILDGKKTVTRRVKPIKVGKIFAVCPGRGKFAVCHCRVVSCVSHRDWILSQGKPNHLTLLGTSFFNKEASREGFDSWSSLENWFNERGQDIESMFRIEFELVN